jgi:hypothetical protein
MQKSTDFEPTRVLQRTSTAKKLLRTRIQFLSSKARFGRVSFQFQKSAFVDLSASLSPEAAAPNMTLDPWISWLLNDWQSSKRRSIEGAGRVKMGSDTMHNRAWDCWNAMQKLAMGLATSDLPSIERLWSGFRNIPGDDVSNDGRYHPAKRRVVGGADSFPTNGTI